MKHNDSGQPFLKHIMSTEDGPKGLRCDTSDHVVCIISLRGGEVATFEKQKATCYRG